MPPRRSKGSCLGLFTRFWQGLGACLGSRPNTSGRRSRGRAAAAIASAAAGAVDTAVRGGSTVEVLEGRTLLSTYYVSGNEGSDANAGTSLSAPFKTIQRAANLVQPGDTVLIRGGTYRETVKPARSGTSSGKITFKPYNGESVTISGANVVGGWSNHKGSIYKAGQGWDLGLGNNQVFVDGQMMVEARWPNTSLNLSRPTKATADSISATSTTGTLNDSALTHPDGTWDGAIMHMVPGQSWFGQTARVTDYSPGRLSFSYQQMTGDEKPTGGDPYYLTGKFVALDTAGEWFRDPNNGQLYLWTPNSDNPGNHRVEAKARDYAFDLRLRQHINIEGVKLFASTITTSASSGNIRVSGIDARYTGHFTIQPGRDQPHDAGIHLEGNNNLIENSRIGWSAGHGIMLFGEGSRAVNNVIHDVAYNAGNSAGVRTAGSGHVVEGNTIYNGGNYGVKISNTTNVKVLRNVIHDVMLQTTDGGGVYTFGINGGGTEIAYNKIYNVKTGGYGGSGIMLDNNSSGYLVHHNVTWNVNHGLKMNVTGKYHKVYNNTFAATDTGLSTNKQRDLTGTVFKNNIFTKTAEFGTGATKVDNLLPGTDFKFVNAGGNDYQLQASSPAVNQGSHVAPFTDGFAGGAPDIGAFEYGKPAFRAGSNIGGANPSPSPTPEPEPEPGPTPVPPRVRDATVRFEAESYDATFGARKATYSIGYTNGGDWIKFSNVDFGSGVSKLLMSIAVENASAGQQIEVRTGSPDGMVHGRLLTAATGGWNNYTVQSTGVGALTGVRDLYIVFQGWQGMQMGIANVDWLRFE